MHVSFALFADGANISQEGKLNILGVFDAVQVPTFPSVHARAHLVVRLKGTRNEAGPHALTFSWKDPQGKELLGSTGQLEIAAPPTAVTELDLPIIMPLDLPLSMPGAFTMVIHLDGDKQAELRLHARDATGPHPGGPMVS